MANEEKEQKLTAKQKRFCEEYIIDWNGTRAAIAAGYSEKTAKEQASQTLTKLNVKSYIDELQKDLQKQVGISRLMVANELKKLAFSNAADLRSGWTDLKQWDQLTDDQKATIGEVVHSEVQIGEDAVKQILKVRQYDKLKALQMLCKMFGWEEPKEEEESKAQDRQPIIMDFGDTTNVDLPNNEDEIASIDLDNPLFLED